MNLIAFNFKCRKSLKFSLVGYTHCRSSSNNHELHLRAFMRLDRIHITIKPRTNFKKPKKKWEEKKSRENGKGKWSEIMQEGELSIRVSLAWFSHKILDLGLIELYLKNANIFQLVSAFSKFRAHLIDLTIRMFK